MADALRLAAEERRGSYLAAFSLGESVQTIIGPALFTRRVERAGHSRAGRYVDDIWVRFRKGQHERSAVARTRGEDTPS